jgi:hypothetical protein
MAESDRIYVEEYDVAGELIESEKGGVKVRSHKEGSDSSEDTDHKEVDPFAPVKAEVFEITEGGFRKTATFDPEDRGTKPKKKKKKEEPEEKPTSTPLVMQAPPIRKKKLEKVVFEGPFGKINAGYLDVYLDGMYVILVEEQDSEFSYTPPESEDPFNIIYEENLYQVISPGINFELPNQKIKITVLLIVGDEDE